MIELRPYQREALTAVGEAYKRGIRRPLVSLPTGTGKTVVFSTIAQGAHQKERRTLILAHRDELLQQARDKLVMCAPELEGYIGMVKGKDNDYYQPVTIASVQSLHKKRLEEITLDGGWQPWDVAVVDESHHAGADSYRRILESIGSFREDTKMLTIGVTATPQRADHKDLGEVFEEVVYHRDILSMMQEGYLCDLKGLQVTLDALDLSDVKVSRGDYVDSQTSAKLLEAEAPLHVCGAWREHASDRQTLIFTPTIALAHEMADEFRRHGIKAEGLSGNTPQEERRDMLRRFSRGEVQVIANAQVLTEGFDEPSISCIVIARPTKSHVLYMQMIGRGTRTYPGKPNCLIIDTVGAANRLDLLTVPKLFGLGEEAVASEAQPSILQLALLKEEKQTRQGVVKVREIALFDRQAFNWLAIRPGTWALVLQGEKLQLQVDGRTGTWSFTTSATGKGVAPNRQLQRTGLTLEMAMGVAEEYARRSPNFANALVSKNAGWRTAPATQGQLDALEKWGMPVTGSLSKGEASDLLDTAIARSRR